MAPNDDDTSRPAISDGKVLRQIWRLEDGSGDADAALFERTRFAPAGHPTWKLYCGDAPEKVNGVLTTPPKSCYLDDRAAYKLLNWDGFTKAERGRYWRHDFGTKGDLRPHRKQRGRPAFIQGGETAYLDGPSKKYRFSGAVDPREIELLNHELAAQNAGRTLLIMPQPSASAAPKPVVPRTAGIFQSLAASGAPSTLPGSNSLSDPAQRKRSISPITAGVANADTTPKKPRYGNPENIMGQ